jgi:hypothetical protein
MKNLTAIVTCLSLGCAMRVVAVDSTPDISTLVQVATTTTNSALPESPILSGAILKTEWHNTRNPFRFETQEERIEVPSTVEQMEVIGISRMPDEDGTIRTYAFVSKTSEANRTPDNHPNSTTQAGRDGKPDPEAKPATDVFVLRNFPEILNEGTEASEEDAEECSIVLTSEQLWFLGVVTQSNNTVAVFWPAGGYPAQEASLRKYELLDKEFRNLPVRRTNRGEKIGGSQGLNTLARVNKTKHRQIEKKPEPARQSARQSAPPSTPQNQPTKPVPIEPGALIQPNDAPGSKPTLSGNPLGDVRDALRNKNKFY